MLARAITVELPHGLFDADGVCHRDAVLRAMTGHEELMLADAGPGDAVEPNPRASASLTQLLVSVLERLGDYDRIDGELVAALTRGDRQALVLYLRAGLYGDRISLVARCPNPGCAALSDVDLQISELVPAPVAPRPHLLCDTPSGAAVIHEPTGADDDEVAARGGSRDDRVNLLWSRLVELDGRRLAADEWPTLPVQTRHAIALALAEGSRAPELTFLARCPTCAAYLEIVIDPFAMLARELRLGGDRLFAEVHALAFHYHWSEAEILALPRPRRWRYLELLGRELEGRPL